MIFNGLKSVSHCLLILHSFLISKTSCFLNIINSKGRLGWGRVAYATLIILTCFDWTLNITSHECHILFLYMPCSLGCSQALNARGYKNGKSTYLLIKEPFGNMCCNFYLLVLYYFYTARLALTFTKYKSKKKGVTNLLKYYYNFNLYTEEKIPVFLFKIYMQ